MQALPNYSVLNFYDYEGKGLLKQVIDVAAAPAGGLLGGKSVTVVYLNRAHDPLFRNRIKALAIAILLLPLTVVSFLALALKKITNSCVKEEERVKTLFLHVRSTLQNLQSFITESNTVKMLDLIKNNPYLVKYNLLLPKEYYQFLTDKITKEVPSEIHMQLIKAAPKYHRRTEVVEAYLRSGIDNIALPFDKRFDFAQAKKFIEDLNFSLQDTLDSIFFLSSLTFDPISKKEDALSQVLLIDFLHQTLEFAKTKVVNSLDVKPPKDKLPQHAFDLLLNPSELQKIRQFIELCKQVYKDCQACLALKDKNARETALKALTDKLVVDETMSDDMKKLMGALRESFDVSNPAKVKFPFVSQYLDALLIDIRKYINTDFIPGFIKNS